MEMVFRKVIIIGIFVIFYFAAAEKSSNEIILESRNYCLDLTNTTQEDTAAILQNNPSVVVTQNMKCYWECYLKKIGWMDENGNLREKPINLSPMPDYVKYASTCGNATGSDSCDKSLNFMKCFYKNTKEQQGANNSRN